jgi:hypothetical protein
MVFLWRPMDGYHKGKNDTGLNENGMPLGAELSILSSTDFSFQNLVFWNLFEFSVAEFT